MNYQDIELLLNSFNNKANNVQGQLTALLSEISDGRVPTNECMSTLNSDISDLREKYNTIYSAAKEMTSIDELPAKGENANIYVEAVRNSRIKLLEEQISNAKAILSKFIAINSKLDIYAQALKPYQDAASELLNQISEETIDTILPQTEISKSFIDAMEFDNISTSTEGLAILQEIGKHYSLEVQFGLATKQYYLGDNADITDTSVPDNQVGISAETDSPICHDSDVGFAEINNEHLSDIEEVEKVGTDNENAESTTEFEINSEENVTIDKSILKATNKLKSGTPSASSFKKEILKIANGNKEVYTILPLFTNLAILTKEQCFQFRVYMGSIEETDKFRSAINSAIDVLAAKGYIACFEYETDGEKTSAYCLSDYCYSCMRKESLKGIWRISLGSNKFTYNMETDVAKSTVIDTVEKNTLLLKYIYSVKYTLTKNELEAVMESIHWDNGHYQVAVFENGTSYLCHLVSTEEDLTEISESDIIICSKEDILDIAEDRRSCNIFVLKNGEVCRLVGKSHEIDVKSISEDLPVENYKPMDKTDSDQNNISVITEEPTEDIDDISVIEAVVEPMKSDADEVTQDVVETEMMVSTPVELLQKKTIPADDEFCNAIFNILAKETVTQDQLKSTIVDAVLLAYGAGLQDGYSKAAELSKQLRLATNILIDESEYTSESILTAFPNIDADNKTMALASYLLALLTPAIPFDYGLSNQTEKLLKDYEVYFDGFEAFKPLFNKLMSVKNVSVAGFSPALIASLGSDDESADYIAELNKKAAQYLTVKAPKTRMKALPALYSDCFGASSDLYYCMKIIAENDKDNLDCVKLILADFCDEQNNTYVLNETKIAEQLEIKWNNKNNFKLAYDAHSQALKQFKVRLIIMKEWVDLISRLNSNQQDLSRLSNLKTDLLDIIHGVLKDNSWKYEKNSNVLMWMLHYMEKYLSGELDKTWIFSDLLFTGVISLDDNGIPVIDASMARIKFYEPWRNALRHIVSIKKSVEDVKAEIRGDILQETDEESGLKDNLHQLIMLGKYLKSDDEDYLVSDEYIKEAIESADDRSNRFNDTLALAYTYNQINENEKDILSGLMLQYKSMFYDNMDFANWRRFLEALELQIQEFAAGRKRSLRAKLDERLKKNADSPLLKEADRLLEKDKNFAVTEEYITRFDSGETELEDELDVILHDKDYFGEFLEHDSFDDLLRICRQGKGRALKNFGLDYVEKKLPKDWTSKNRDDSRTMISSWPTRKDAATPTQIQTLFKCLGFDVTNAVRKHGYKEDLFQISVRPTAKSMADYRHPIASFGTQIKSTINVILVDANYTPRQLVDSVTSLDLGGISIVIYNQPIDAAGRRMIGEIFHTQTSELNPFLLLDQVLFLYLAMHQETERMPALLKCTLPYTTYQPFVRDGGSTADEMFCGRAKELATIIDPNGACVVYGGRQLGKTALLERAESRCSKPESKEYAVYSSINKIDNEVEVIDTLISDIDKKTNGKVKLSKCGTLKEMCSQLSKMFISGQIATMHLFIDEVDCFLAAIADEAYSPIQPLIDLKRETKNNFKFVLTGLHNVCRAKNATRDNGIFGQLGTPLCIKPLSPTDALRLLSRPLSYLGFQIERYPHLETILTKTNYYPGILQFFGYMLVETLADQYSKYYSAAEGNPPFTLQDEQLGSIMNSSDLDKSIKNKFRLSLELDERYFMIARCITMLYYLYEENWLDGNWMGFKVEDIRSISKSYNIHCLENESDESFANLLDEMVEMGILSQPISGLFRLRRSSFVDIIGENFEMLDHDIIVNNKVIS